MSDWANRFIESHKSDAPYPNLSTEAPHATIAEAYGIQNEFVAALPGAVEGYKAALTAAPAQQAMGIDAPVYGVLFHWGAREPGTLSEPRPLILETELGDRLGDDIDAPTTAIEVVDRIATCHPMIELASPNLAGKPQGIDLIATNSASFAFIQGTAVAMSDVAIDSITATLTLDAATLHEARSDSVMDGQANALAWLVNQVLDQGGSLRAGMLLMTGSVGPPHPGKPGAYHADFGPLGTIEFSIG